MATAVEFLSHGPSHDFSDEWYLSAVEDHFWVQWRFRAMTQMISTIPSLQKKHLKALDIGGGHGVMAASLEERYGWTVDCCELNEKALQQGKRIQGRRFFYDITEEHPSLIGKYDVVLLCDVIEHLEYPENLLRSAMRHLVPGGVLIVNVPALSLLYSRFDKTVGHYRRYTVKSLQKEVAGAGGKILASGYWGFSLLPIALLRKWVVGMLPSAKAVVEVGFSPPSALVHQLFRYLMRLETKVAPITPVGTSVLLAAQSVAD